MAVDKLVDSTQLDADLTSVANAIRSKGGTSAQLSFPGGMVDAIGAISSGGYAVAFSTARLGSDSRTISFDVSGEPVACAVIIEAGLTPGYSGYVVSILKRTSDWMITAYGINSSDTADLVAISSSLVTATYSGGSYSITVPTYAGNMPEYFKRSTTYRLMYVYGE